MHDYMFTTEVVRFAFMFGVAVSMLLYERRHLTTGSIVVPGYIATFLAMPLTIVATFLNAFISYWLVNKLLRRWFLLYGRTKFTVLASISIVIQSLMLEFSPVGAWMWESNIKLMVGVGYVVPALIAHDMGRQGIKKTVKSVTLAGCIVAVPIALALAVNMPGVNDLAPLRGGGELAIEVGWIPIAVLLSAASAWGVARYWGLRSGGFMGAAFVAILLGDPWVIFGRSAIEQAAARLRATEERRRATTGEVAIGIEHDPWYSFAFASYHRWAALHNEAAAAAEQWLATMLGETPAFAAAGIAPSRGVGASIELPHVHLPHPHLPQSRHTVNRQESTGDATGATAPADPHTTIDRIRAAAHRALTAPAHTVREPVLPQRRRPTPQRRPGGQRRGEFDAVSMDLAQQATRLGRLDGIPNTGAADSGWLPTIAPDAGSGSLASPRPRLPLGGDPISEPSDATTTRAHQPVASDGRSTSTTPRDGSEEEAGTTPLTS